METRITIDRLWFEFGNDAYYGEESPCGEVNSINSISIILHEIGFEKTGFRLKPWCRKCVPGNYYPPLALALVMCGMDELDTFLPGEKEPTGWKYESLSKNFRDDLEVNLNDLKYLMRKRHLPLPVALFPTDQGNTEEAIRLNGEEYQKAFAEFAAIADVERDVREWEVMNPTSITEKSLKEQKLKELRDTLQMLKNNASVGMDSLKPIEERSIEDIHGWAEEEWWPKAIAISRVVSSQGGDLNDMHARIRNLLARTTNKDWKGRVKTIEDENGVFVNPSEWLVWCKTQGFDASEAVWNTVCKSAGTKRAQDCYEQYPELSIDALTTLADLDAELYPNAYDTGLGGELDERLGELLTKGYESEQAGKILDAIIRKGEQLKVIAERESLPCQSQSEVDSRNRAIKDAQNENEKINRELDNGVVTQQENAQIPAEIQTGYNETPQHDDRLESFKPFDGAFASEVSIKILDDYWLEVTKVGCKSQIVHCASLKLLWVGQTKLNRAGEMLYSLVHSKTSTKLKAPSQAMKDLRKTLRNIVGISDDTFTAVKGGWDTLFTLQDKRGLAKVRKDNKSARLLVQFNDGVGCDSGSATMARIETPEELTSRKQIEEGGLFTGGSAKDEEANKWMHDNT
ncbi:MAG: hypothetical protein JKY87_06625 [Mariprofundus sp.]|nr:hypothetical protein [Mariprofundus sp.]